MKKLYACALETSSHAGVSTREVIYRLYVVVLLVFPCSESSLSVPLFRIIASSSGSIAARARLTFCNARLSVDITLLAKLVQLWYGQVRIAMSISRSRLRNRAIMDTFTDKKVTWWSGPPSLINRATGAGSLLSPFTSQCYSAPLNGEGHVKVGELYPLL